MRKVVVLACILSLLTSAAVMAGCGSSGSSSQNPEQATKTFFAAYGKKDANTTWNMLSANSIKQLQTKTNWEESLKTGTVPTNIKIGKVTVNGDKATAKVTGTAKGITSTVTIPLVKENGVWKVDMAGAAVE